MTLVTYTRTGPFTNGAAPGISAAFLNAMETFLTATGAAWDSNASWDGSGNLTALGHVTNPPAHSVTGGTSGSASLYQVFLGTFKLLIVNCVGMRTAGSNQDVAIPTPFTTTAIILTGNLGNGQALNLISSGTAQNVGIVTTLAAAGGSGTLQANFFGNSFLSINHAFDTVRFVSGASAGATGLVLIVGI